MAEIKDKVVTVDSLAAVHDYNQKTFMPMVNPEAMGDLSVHDGDGWFSGDVYVGGDNKDNGTKLVKSPNVLSIEYGDELPEAGTVGRIFFKRITDN